MNQLVRCYGCGALVKDLPGKPHKYIGAPYCQQQNIGVIVRGPLAMGKLTGKFSPETTFPEGDIRGGWLEGESRENFLHDLALVERLRFLANGRTMAQAALAYVLAHPADSTTIPRCQEPAAGGG